MERQFEIAQQSFQDVTDALLAPENQTVNVGSTDQTHTSTQGQSFGDISTTTNPRVEPHFYFIPDGIDDTRKNAERRVPAVDLATAVV